MEYKQGDRVLYNRQKFGTVRSSQFNPREVDVVFDREKGSIIATRVDMLELVADEHHEAVLTALINSPSKESPIAAELVKLADELVEGADPVSVASRLRAISKAL